jgi:hypothetical protein
MSVVILISQVIVDLSISTVAKMKKIQITNSFSSSGEIGSNTSEVGGGKSNKGERR